MCGLGHLAGNTADDLVNKFGEKAGEKLIEIAGDFFAERTNELRGASSQILEKVVQECFRKSLADIHRQSSLGAAYSDWFENWDTRLRSPELLELSTEPQDLDRAVSNLATVAKSYDHLLEQMLERLDSEGGTLAKGFPSLLLRTRCISQELSRLLPASLANHFEMSITQPDNERAWKLAERVYRDRMFKSLSSIEMNTNELTSRLMGVTDQLSALFLREDHKPDQARLPISHSYFLGLMEHPVGRDVDICALVNRSMTKPERPLRICGAPGIGKSTLARAVLRTPEMQAKFGTRRYEVHCDNLTSCNDLISRIARDWFRITESDPNLILDLLLTELTRLPCAVLIDNFETLWRHPRAVARDASLEFVAQLAAVPSLRLMVGPQGLDKPGELPWDDVEVRPLSDGSARELFLKASRRPEFAESDKLAR